MMKKMMASAAALLVLTAGLTACDGDKSKQTVGEDGVVTTTVGPEDVARSRANDVREKGNSLWDDTKKGAAEATESAKQGYDQTKNRVNEELDKVKENIRPTKTVTTTVPVPAP